MSRKNEMHSTNERNVSFGEAIRFWLKLGFISFGGPAGQISIMHRELVENRRWLSEERFIHALNYCMLLPGPEAQQLAVYIGWLMHRVPGGIVAGVLFVLPSVFILLLLSYLYAVYGNVGVVLGVLNGFKPVVVAIVVEAVLKIGKRSLKRRVHFLIAAAAFIAINFLHLPFPLVVLAAGVIGLGGTYFLPAMFGVNQKAEDSKRQTDADIKKTDIPLVINDDSPAPPHTLPSFSRSLRTLIVGLILWVLPFAALGAWLGWNSLHAQEYRFFTVAALVTFGGAYAVLSYVTQTVVSSYGWVSHLQAVDGLALAETTPGPLIMVLQFIGFMAVWNNTAGQGRFPMAILGAVLTTYVTFLPSFIYIFIGAPYIEKLRDNTNLTGALNGVTAAVVGVILNLALVFGAVVIFPNGLTGEINGFAIGLTFAAFFSLFYFKLNVLWVVLGGGLIGFGKMMLWGS